MLDSLFDSVKAGSEVDEDLSKSKFRGEDLATVSTNNAKGAGRGALGGVLESIRSGLQGIGGGRSLIPEAI